jgi:hypothetical protein
VVLPEWDISISVPTTYNKTLGEILDKAKDSSISCDPQRDSLIIFSANLSIDPIYLSDSIQITPQKAESNIQLSEFTFQPSQKYSYIFTLNEIFPGLLTGNVIVPPLSQDASKTILLNDFQYIDIESGTGLITIQNKFPFPIEFRSPIIFKNTSNGQEVARLSIQRIIYPDSSYNGIIDLSGKNLSNSVSASFTISTPGTTGYVQISNSNYLSIDFSLKDIKIKSGSTALSAQKYVSTRYFSIDSTNQSSINQVNLKTGLLNIEINNSTNFKLQIKAKFYEITKANNPLLISFDLNSRENRKFPLTNVSGYTITPINNKINYDLEINITNTNNQIITFSKDDFIKYKISLEKISVDYLEGKVKTTTANIDQSVEIPISDIKKFLDGSILLSEANVEILLNNKLGVQFSLAGGQISGFNSSSGKIEKLDIPNILIDQKSSKPITLDKTATANFINSFSRNNSFPETFRFKANVTINPNQSNCTISSNDYLYGNVNIKVPMQISIINIQSKDTTDFSFSDSDKEQFDKLNHGTLSITAYNSIPVNSSLKIRFLDALKKEMLSIPIGGDFLTINSPELNSDGTVRAPLKTVIPLTYTTLNKDNILKIRDSKYCEYQLNLSSQNAPNVYARFQRQESLKLSLLLEIGYHIKDTSNK